MLQDLLPKPDASKEKQFKQSAKSRYRAIDGCSVGAIVGLTLIGGPLGLLAGSWIGGSTAKKLIQSKGSTGHEQDECLQEASSDNFDHDIVIPGPDFGINF
jgi:hypothetical protein